MQYIQDNINFWKMYERTKDKELINFEKQPEMKKKFLKLVFEIKKKVI